MNRNAYLLTLDKNSKRAISSKQILQSIGFNVITCIAIPNIDHLVSHKISMLEIYDKIAKSNDEWSYVFEDDILTHFDISLEKLVKYEDVSSNIFFLGCCVYSQDNNKCTDVFVNDENVVAVSGTVRGLHAIAISKTFASIFRDKCKSSNEKHIDVLLDIYTETHPCNVVRFDLETDISGHRGLFYQDRKNFASTLEHFY